MLVLEEGRKPSFEASCVTRMGIAGGVILLGFGVLGLSLVRRHRS